MRSIFSNIAFLVAFGLALVFTFSCSSGGGGGDGSISSATVDSSSSVQSSTSLDVVSSSSFDESSSSAEMVSSSSFEQSSSSMEVASSSSSVQGSMSSATVSSSSSVQGSSSSAIVSSSSSVQGSSSSATVNYSSSVQSSSSVPEGCEGITFNPANKFCYDGAVYDKCDGMEYIPTRQICTNGVANPARCGGVGYNPLTQNCCGSAIYSRATQKCTNGIVETKCGSSWYDASNTNLRCQSSVIETKCGSSWYDASNTNLRCQSSVVETKCGSGWYDASNTNLRCQNSVIEAKCGIEWYSASNSNLRCQNTVIETKCGSVWYDASNTNLRCQNSVIEAKCGSSWYNSTTHFCYNSSKIGNFCGINPQKYYNPDLYECKTGSNGIYLKTPISYENENYDAVLIGTQTWMAKNLNYNAIGSKCYGEGGMVYDGNTNITLSNAEIQANCEKYGRLYDWSTAMGISTSYNGSSYNPSANTKYRGVCPNGWHIPNNAELDRLMHYVDGTGGTSSHESPTASKHLKAKEGWNNCGPSGSGKANLCEDTYGFSALPGGSGYEGVSFNSVGDVGQWWGASEDGYRSAYYLWMAYGNELAYYSYHYKGYLWSVRCLQD